MDMRAVCKVICISSSDRVVVLWLSWNLFPTYHCCGHFLRLWGVTRIRLRHIDCYIFFPATMENRLKFNPNYPGVYSHWALKHREVILSS